MRESELAANNINHWSRDTLLFCHNYCLFINECLSIENCHRGRCCQCFCVQLIQIISKRIENRNNRNWVERKNHKTEWLACVNVDQLNYIVASIAIETVRRCALTFVCIVVCWWQNRQQTPSTSVISFNRAQYLHAHTHRERERDIHSRLQTRTYRRTKKRTNEKVKNNNRHSRSIAYTYIGPICTHTHFDLYVHTRALYVSQLKIHCQCMKLKSSEHLHFFFCL